MRTFSVALFFIFILRCLLRRKGTVSPLSLLYRIARNLCGDSESGKCRKYVTVEYIDKLSN